MWWKDSDGTSMSAHLLLFLLKRWDVRTSQESIQNVRVDSKTSTKSRTQVHIQDVTSCRQLIIFSFLFFSCFHEFIIVNNLFLTTTRSMSLLVAHLQAFFSYPFQKEKKDRIVLEILINLQSKRAVVTYKSSKFCISVEFLWVIFSFLFFSCFHEFIIVNNLKTKNAWWVRGVLWFILL
jgi:hypothetical protein